MSDSNLQDHSHKTNNNSNRKAKTWRILCLVSFSLVLISSCILYLKQRYSPKQCVSQFIHAIESQDYSTLKKFIRCDGVTINEQTLEPLVLLYQSDSQFQKDIRNTLNRDLSRVNLDTYASDHWIKLIPHRKFLIKTYTVAILPVTMDFSSNLSQVEISYNDQLQMLGDEASLESFPLLPGLYPVKASYHDELRDKNVTKEVMVKLYSNQDIDLSFDCTNLILDLPKDYSICSMDIDEISISEIVLGTTETLTLDPIFAGSVITISCLNPWNDIETTSFSIPEEQLNSTYEFTCNFDSTSMEFVYQPGLTITGLSINANSVPNYADYVNSEDNKLILSSLLIGTEIQIELTTPWKERFNYTHVIDKADFTEYTQQIQCKLSEDTKSDIIECAGEYYLHLFDCFNNKEIEHLETYAENDEMASDLLITLENIAYDYELYSAEDEDFKEEIALTPERVLADRYKINYYSESMVVPIEGTVKTLSTTSYMNSEAPTLEVGKNYYNVLLYLNYDTKKKEWYVNQSYYNYEPFILNDSVDLLH